MQRHLASGSPNSSDSQSDMGATLRIWLYFEQVREAKFLSSFLCVEHRARCEDKEPLRYRSHC